MIFVWWHHTQKKSKNKNEKILCSEIWMEVERNGG